MIKITDAQEAIMAEMLEEIHKEIPENSSSILINEATSRFSGASWYEEVQKHDILLAGLGGIGSYVAFLLARLNVNSLILYDSDVVEQGNLSGQLYEINNVGGPKVNAAAIMCIHYGNYQNVIACAKNFLPDSPPEKIMICGFDNMAARKTYFESWIAYRNTFPVEEWKDFLFIDGRLAAETLQVLCLRGDDTYNIEQYKEKFLFTDKEADATVCSYKQTTFMANMIGSVIANLYVNFCANRVEGILIERDLPFFTQYEAETMFFKTIN